MVLFILAFCLLKYTKRNGKTSSAAFEVAVTIQQSVTVHTPAQIQECPHGTTRMARPAVMPCGRSTGTLEQ